MSFSPLRILHVSNFGMFPKGVAHYGIAPRLSNGWVRAGHNVISFSERDIARWFGLGNRKLGRWALNNVLLEAAEGLAPDILALGHADNVKPATIARLRNTFPNMRVLQYTVDAIVGEPYGPNTINRQLSKLEVVDASLATTPGEALRPLEANGKIAAFFPNPVDPSIDRPRGFENPAPKFDLAFLAGGVDIRFHAGVWRTPDDLARMLLAEVPNLRPAFGGVLNHPHFFREAFEALMKETRLGLNISRRNDIYLYSSDRMAHFAGAGVAVVTDRASGFADLVGEDSCCFYTTEEDLFSRLRALKADDAAARALAERGWRKFHQMFDSRIVGQYMLDLLLGNDVSNYPWPNRPGTKLKA